MRALLNGELLGQATMKQMLTGVPTGEDLLPGSQYGLGIESTELSCGTAWGHSGDIPGFQTRNAVAADGTAFTVTVTALPWAIFDGPDDELLKRYLVVIDTIDTALCDPASRP
jgi:D-alanyl-D-alanine carboxypeptidase